jgi:hypothetical protein
MRKLEERAKAVPMALHKFEWAACNTFLARTRKDTSEGLLSERKN